MIRLFKVSIPSSAVALILSDTVLAYLCYLLAAYLVIDTSMVTFLFEEGGYWAIGLVNAIVILGLYFNDLYENYRVRSRIRLIQQFCLVLGVAFLLQSLLGYGQLSVMLPKWVMVYGSAMVLLVLPLWRVLFTTLLWKAGGQKLLFLGSSPAMREIVSRIVEAPELGLAAIGYLQDEGSPAQEFLGVPRLGSLADLDAVIAEKQPARVIVGMERPDTLPVPHLLNLRLAGLNIEEASATYESIFGRVCTMDLAPAQLVFSEKMRPGVTSAALQSIYGALLGLIALVLALPVMAVLALILKASSSGPVLTRRTAAGLHGKPFTRILFRCPPGTAIGRWLREWRFHELPQLFNVFLGQMALVGPRPEAPAFTDLLERQIPYYRQRQSVKPGITGWAQLNETPGVLQDAILKLEYDRYYIKNLSIWLDVYILFHTLKDTIVGRDVH